MDKEYTFHKHFREGPCQRSFDHQGLNRIGDLHIMAFPCKPVSLLFKCDLWMSVVRNASIIYFVINVYESYSSHTNSELLPTKKYHFLAICISEYAIPFRSFPSNIVWSCQVFKNIIYVSTMWVWREQTHAIEHMQL